MHSLEEKYLANKLDDQTYSKWHSSFTYEFRKQSSEITKLTNSKKHVSALYIENLQYLTDLNYLYIQAPIEEKQGYLKSIFPGCLTATIEGYRTPTINKLFSSNTLSIGALLEIKSKRGLPFSEKSPIWVETGNELEHFLKIIESIIKRV